MSNDQTIDTARQNCLYKYQELLNGLDGKKFADGTVVNIAEAGFDREKPFDENNESTFEDLINRLELAALRKILEVKLALYKENMALMAAQEK